VTLTNRDITDLLPMCKRGEQAAQLEVYNRYYKAMFNTAVRIVKDEAEAQDVMQESFLNAFTKLDSFKGEATFGSWLKRIVVNKSLNSYHRSKRIDETSIEDHLYKIEDDSQGVAEADYDNLQVHQVMNAMDELKDNYRQSLALHLIEGYDYEEMSEIMNISYANCRTLVSRAKESLRKILNNNEEGRYKTTI